MGMEIGNLGVFAPPTTTRKQGLQMDPTTTVLIADDHPDALALLVLIVETLGCQAMSAEDGAEAIKLAKEKRPDIAFLDLSMPVLDGFQALEGLRRLFKDGMPLYAVSAHCSQKDMEAKALAAGANKCICKPVDVDVIEATLRLHHLL